MQRAWWLTLAVLVAGCSSPEGPDIEDELDIEVEVDEGLGAIVGVVVDDRISPIVGAVVTLRTEPPQNTTTDERGEFAFTNLPPGTYFVAVSSLLHHEVQASIAVDAGDDPPVTRILMERLFEADPYTVQVKRNGYFQCSQAGAGLYSSSNCAYDPYRWAFGPDEDSPTQQIDNTTQQEREWHSDVGPGWQTLVFEMEWEPTSSGTSEYMGIVVSTYKPEREGSHWFAEAETGSPLLLRLNVGEQHPSGSGTEPSIVPPSGMQDMSYFVSVKQDNWPAPAFAIEQEFTLILTQFYYLPAPEGWSFLQGDPLPF